MEAIWIIAIIVIVALLGLVVYQLKKPQTKKGNYTGGGGSVTGPDKPKDQENAQQTT